jgi:hypothetical protein
MHRCVKCRGPNITGIYLAVSQLDERYRVKGLMFNVREETGEMGAGGQRKMPGGRDSLRERDHTTNSTLICFPTLGKCSFAPPLVFLSHSSLVSLVSKHCRQEENEKSEGTNKEGIVQSNQSRAAERDKSSHSGNQPTSHTHCY